MSAFFQKVADNSPSKAQKEGIVGVQEGAAKKEALKKRRGGLTFVENNQAKPAATKRLCREFTAE